MATLMGYEPLRYGDLVRTALAELAWGKVEAAVFATFPNVEAVDATRHAIVDQARTFKIDVLIQERLDKGGNFQIVVVKQ